MKNKAETIRESINSMRGNRSLNSLYSSPSTFRDNLKNLSRRSKEASFIVPWQMQEDSQEEYNNTAFHA